MSRQAISGRDPGTGKSIEVAFEDGWIKSVQETERDEEAWLCPGLIDLQINGYGGDDVNLDEPDPEVIISLTEKSDCSRRHHLSPHHHHSVGDKNHCRPSSSRASKTE